MFVNYPLSEAAQMVLFTPEIARVPVIPTCTRNRRKDYPESV